jgi:putative copper export protein
MKRTTARELAAAAAASLIIAALAAGTSWRLALVAALAAGAIALTRLRYSALVAIGLLVITLALAQTGHTAGPDDRHVPAKASHR